MSESLLSVRNLTRHFDISGGLLDQIRFAEAGFTGRRPWCGR